MRYCYLDQTLEFDCKEAPENAPKTIKPWFNLTSALKDNHWIFGHWAALMGKCEVKNTYALDTGCVWGGYLTLLRWHDKKIFTQQALS
jgi:bis(5'-nucleosyl)-tetraphosphatase (symmetrical)